MRKKAIVFLILYCLTVFAGCSVNQKREPSSETSTPIHSSTADIRQETEFIWIIENKAGIAVGIINTFDCNRRVGSF